MEKFIEYQGEKIACYEPSSLYGEEMVRIDILQNLNIFISKNGGSIFIFNIDRNSRDYIVRKFEDISAAIRAQEHIVEYYLGSGEGRKGEVYFFDDMNSQINNILASLKNWDSYNQLQKCNVVTEVELILNRLEGSRLELKKDISKQVGHLSSPEDRLGRKNIGAKYSSGLAAKKKSRKRARDSDTSEYLARKRRRALKTEELIIKRNLQSATLGLALLEARKNELDPSVLKKKKGQLMFFIQSIWVNPYHEKAKHLKESLRSI